MVPSFWKLFLYGCSPLLLSLSDFRRLFCMIEEIQETGILICFISFKRQEVKSLIRGSLDDKFYWGWCGGWVRGGDKMTSMRGALIVKLSDSNSAPLYYRINFRKVMPINIITKDMQGSNKITINSPWNVPKASYRRLLLQQKSTHYGVFYW